MRGREGTPCLPLRVAGLLGRWGADRRNFLRFFEELQNSPNERDWEFLLDMTEDYLASGGSIDEDFGNFARRELRPVE